MTEAAAVKAEKVLVLRTCGKDMSSSHGFTWPTSGPVACKNWDPAPVCGSGLHGLLWGEGDGGLLNWGDDARWLVVAVDADIVDIRGKVKFPRGEVVCCGTREEALTYLDANGGASHAVVGSTRTAGDGGTATAGDGGSIAIKWWDAKKERYRLRVADVGRGGELKADTPYRLNDKGEFVEVVKEAKASA